MVRTRRSRRNKLRPPLPDERDLINTPRYFGIIHGAGSGKKKKELELPLPLIMPKAKRMPRPIPDVKRGRNRRERVQTPMPKPEQVPLVIKAGRAFRSLLTRGEPVWPDNMPTYPKLNNPRLYTRYPSMKTVTKVTDANGKIVVDFPRPFGKIPEVIITINGEEKLLGNVTDRTLSAFTAIFFTVEHSHGGAVVDNGRHRPIVNADGGHMHEVYGELYYTKYWTYGWLAPYYYTTDESDPGDPHHHNVSNAPEDDHYMTDLDITEVYLWTSYEEDPLHDHTAEIVTEHDHEVITDGGVLWTDSSVTITYMAQVDEDK